MKIFPWQRDEKPYWVNPENGIEWYIDEQMIFYCDCYINDWPVLKAICFFVVENVNGVRNCISRVLIDSETNEVLADETSLEAISIKIEMMRFSSSSKIK